MVLVDAMWAAAVGLRHFPFFCCGRSGDDGSWRLLLGQRAPGAARGARSPPPRRPRASPHRPLAVSAPPCRTIRTIVPHLSSWITNGEIPAIRCIGGAPCRRCSSRLFTAYVLTAGGGWGWVGAKTQTGRVGFGFGGRYGAAVQRRQGNCLCDQLVGGPGRCL